MHIDSDAQQRGLQWVRDKASEREADQATPTMQPPVSQSDCLGNGKLPPESCPTVIPLTDSPKYADARRMTSATLASTRRFTDLRLPGSG